MSCSKDIEHNGEPQWEIRQEWPNEREWIAIVLSRSIYLLFPLALSGTTYIKSIKKFNMMVSSINKRVLSEL